MPFENALVRKIVMSRLTADSRLFVRGAAFHNFCLRTWPSNTTYFYSSVLTP